MNNLRHQVNYGVTKSAKIDNFDMLMLCPGTTESFFLQILYYTLEQRENKEIQNNNPLIGRKNLYTLSCSTVLESIVSEKEIIMVGECVAIKIILCL